MGVAIHKRFDPCGNFDQHGRPSSHGGFSVAYDVVQLWHTTKLLIYRGVDADRKAGLTLLYLAWHMALADTTSTFGSRPVPGTLR